MYLYGKNSVLERLKTNSQSIRTIYLQDNFKAPALLKAIQTTNIPTKLVTERELNRIKRADRLQGIVARVDDYEYTPFKDLLCNPPVDEGGQGRGAKNKRLTFIFLDSINDPHNLGSIMRIAACFGGFSIVLPKHGSCVVNDTVMHVASGGENFTPVSMVNNMTAALLKAKKEGYWIVGTVVEDGVDIDSVSLPFPVCLVLGSEGKGIRYGIRKHLDMKVSLPMSGAALSFNVAMACAIFCHEISRQRSAEQKR
jgi:23S rRNA (guanosine2251-2'-O)-methyltransferase